MMAQERRQMSEATADRANVARSLIIWAIALVAGALVAWIVGGLIGLGTAAGLIFGAATFVVLPYLLPAGRSAEGAAAPIVHAPVDAGAHARPAPVPQDQRMPPEHAEPAAAHFADPSGMAAAPIEEAAAPGATISERVREAAKAAGEAARAAAGDVPSGDKPAGLDGPRGGVPDHLKRIKGVGPKIEGVLHELGIYHFDQIAAWGPAELAWIDAHIEGFSGRAIREDWVGQAAILASGGETEHSRRVDRGEST
jgi:NADH-quinone oxidoreductase subunit E